MKIHFIINPTSGRESGKQTGNELADRLAERGHIVSREFTEQKGDASKAAQNAAHQESEIVVACGGDGTVNEVVQGLAVSERKPLLSIYAQGTVNDFATQLQLPTDTDAYIRMLERGNRMSLDIGKINDSYFMNVASFGDVSKIGHEVDIQAKTMLGRLAYVIEGIRTVPDLVNTPMPMRIVMDTGQIAEGDFLFAGIANSRSVGGFANFAPAALVNDGVMDLVIIRRTDIVTLGQILISLRSGSHISRDEIEYYQAREFEVTAERETAIDIDGEEGGYLPAKVQVLPSLLTCIIP